MDIFGWKIEKEKERKGLEPSFASEPNDDGSTSIAASGAWNAIISNPVGMPFEGGVRTEAELITRYREMSLYPDVDMAIEHIVNEAIVGDEKDPVKIILDSVELSDSIKKTIEAEFDYILNLLRFNHKGHDIFRNWYVDGRIHYHAIIDKDNPGEGIQALRYIDSTKIKKVREYEKTKKDGLVISKIKSEYYVYSEKGFTSTRPGLVNDVGVQGVKIHPDAVVQSTSGLMDPKRSMVISFLHKGIRPLGQLRNMEDALVIYRLARAPERRVFYIDVGTLPPAKAEQYMQKMMTKFKNKVIYDSGTGEIRSDRKFNHIMEDFWLPRRGERGTEISTLPGGQTLGQMEDVVYFQQKLYNALNIPVSRLNPDDTFNLGRASEITRDELLFQKFIDRLRARFSNLFSEALGRQLVLKNICTPQDWKDIEGRVIYQYARDNYMAELKETEILQDRINLLDRISQYEGRYYSREWIKKNVLFQDEQEIEDMTRQIEAEKILYADEYADQAAEEEGQGGPPGQ